MKSEALSQHGSQTVAPPGIDEIREAAKRIRPHAHLTPVLTCAAIDRMVGGSVFFKCENFQKAGAFKFRAR